MFNFEIKIKGRKAIPVEKKKTVSGSVNADSVSFQFSGDEWENTTKTAVFYIDKDTVYEQLLDENGCAKIPWELLQTAGENVKVGVYGVYGTGEDRVVITSTVVSIEISEGTIVGANADPGEYENIYVQVLARLTDIEDALPDTQMVQTAIVPEWQLYQSDLGMYYYATRISSAMIKITELNDAITIKVKRTGLPDKIIDSSNEFPVKVYSDDSCFDLFYMTVDGSPEPPTVIVYDTFYNLVSNRKISDIKFDHDITGNELVNKLKTILETIYLSLNTTLAGLDLKDNITISDLFYAFQSAAVAKANPAGGNYGLVELAGGSETGDWHNRRNNEVGTIFNIANAITSGEWSDSQMSDQSNNIVKNSVIKAYVDAVRNDKLNEIRMVTVNDGYWVDLEAYPGIQMYDLVTTNHGLNLWCCYGITNDGKAYVNKIASVTGSQIAENAYTKSEVNALIAAIEKMTKRKVQELPETGEDNVIYLVPKTGETDDVYDEWMWIDNQWEHFGNTQIDLSGYVPTSRELGRLQLDRNYSLIEFATKIIDAIVLDSGSKMADLVNRLDDFFQLKENGKGLSTNDYSNAEKKKVADIIGIKKDNTILDIGTIEQGNFGGQNENLSSTQICRTALLEVDLSANLNISLPENIKYIIYYGDTTTYSASNQFQPLTSAWTNSPTAYVSAKYIRIKFAAYDGGGNRIDITPDMLEDVVITYDSFEAIPSHIYENKVVKVAATTATDIEKQYADLICDGVGDEEEINQGLQILASIGGGTLELSSGTFLLDNFTVGSDGVYRAIKFPNVDGITITIKGKGGMVKDNLVGTCVDLSFAAYTALDNSSNNQYELFGQDVTATLSSTVLYMSDIRFRSPRNQKKFIFIDLYNFGRVELNHVYVYAFKNVTGGNTSPAVEGLIGLRMLRGSNFGTENNYLSCGMNGCYEGWQVGSEHVYMRQCSAIYNVYGYTFGNYEWTNAFLHPIVMIKCTDERNINLPLFKKCGFYSGSVNKGQRIDMIDFSIERKTEGTPGHVLGNLAVEDVDGTFNGEISFTMLNNNNVNSVDVAFFQSGGSNFKIRNSAQKLVGTNTLRNSYAANQWQEFYSTDDNCLYRYVNGSWVADFTPSGTVTDVQINGTTIVSSGVANIPKAGTSTYGAIKANSAYGVETDNQGNLVLKMASDAEIKSASGNYRPISASKEHQGVFYGMAKAAGDNTQSSSNNPVGTYTDTAKKKIREMIGADGREWDELMNKTISTANSTALDFTEIDFGSKYKTVRVNIINKSATSAATLQVFFNDSTQQRNLSVGTLVANTRYELEIEASPILGTAGTSYDTNLTLIAYNTNDGTITRNCKVVSSYKLSELNQLKLTLSGSNTFGADSKVAVWGKK